MNSKVKALMIVAMCGMLVGCSKSEYTKVSGSPYAALNGREAKKVYNSLTTTGIASLNYLQTSAAANATHFANFVDGLLTHNEFGVLELNLAESAKHNDDYTQFEFKVRQDENLVWVDYNGNPYTYYEDGENKVQRIKASDWLTAAKIVCNFKTGSDTYYLMTDFIKGALEYYLYTEILDGIAQGTKEFTALTTDAKKAAWIQKKIKSEHENVYSNGGYEENPVTADDIANIANGSRFGVTADEATHTVKYQLMSSAFYFPTLLTYSCYLPVNEHFYTEKGSAFGASANDSILYCGPYVLSQLDETNIIYKKNETYAKRADIRGFMKADVDTVKYNIVKSEIDSTYTRTQFQDGNIDGFSLNKNDNEGWSEFVTGEDGTGTLENPASGLVNSRLLDTIGSMYGSNLVLERSSSGTGATSYSTYGSATTVKNTEKALRIQEVRQAIMKAEDYENYYSWHFGYNAPELLDDTAKILSKQYAVHTYVPKNFVYDDNGNEYTQKYYAEALASHDGSTVEEAQTKITAGEYDAYQLSQEEVNQLVAKAQDAIAKYNAANPSDQITYPINIEYFSMWDADQESKVYDNKTINAMNKRLNNISEVAADYSNCTIFKMVPTDKVTTSNYNAVSGSSSGSAAYDFSFVNWGWGADYGDPLTFMNTYTKGGDWKSIFPFIGKDSVTNYYLDDDGNLQSNDLLAEYSQLVKEGAKETENLTNRYTKFAEAEVLLIEDLAIYAPQVNYGQGWSLSISKSAGYEMPQSNYGLSSDRLTGMWVLKEPLTRVERNSIREEFNVAKAEYTSTHPTYNIYGE